MSDPLADPRAVALLRSDPGEVGSLAGTFHRVASQAQTAASGLRGARDAHWASPAADAFREKLGKLPGDLDKVQQSYSGVADALTRYEGELGPTRVQFQNLSTQLREARDRLGTAQGQLSSAQGDLSRAAHAKGATDTSAPVVSAQSAVTQATGAVNGLQDEVQGLERRGFQILDDFDHVREDARTAVSHAASIAPEHHSRWFSSVCHAVGNFVSGAVKSIGQSFTDLFTGKAIVNFIEHPSWKTFGELAKDVAVVASTVAMVVAPFAAPELAEADALLAGAEGVEGAAAGAEGAAGAADASSFGSKVASAVGKGGYQVNKWGGRISTGSVGAGALSDYERGDWGAFALDAALIVAPNLGHMPANIDGVKTVGDRVADVAGVGDRGLETAKGTLENVKDYRLLRSMGINPVGARSLTFSDGIPKSLQDLDLTSTEATQAAQAGIKQAAGRAMHLGKPLAGVADKLITEPGADKIKEKVSPEPEPVCG